MTLTIVSGAAPGVEQGAIEAAVNLALHWHGWASREHIDRVPAVYRTGLQPTTATDPGMVRRLNIQDSDGALVFSTSMVLVGVPAFVDRVTEQMGRAFLHVTLNPALFGGGCWIGIWPDSVTVDRRVIPDEVRDHVRNWIRSNELARVYVTGPSADDVPGIQGAVRDALIAILEPFAVDEVRQTTRMLLTVAADSPDRRRERAMVAADALEELARVGGRDPEVSPPEGLDALQRAQLDASIREAERDIRDPVAEFLDSLACCPRPPSEQDIDQLIEEFYKLEGNGAGGSLHVVLDDNNWERECVEFCREAAAERNDVAGERLADLLLTLTDEQLRAWIGAGYCGRCGADHGEEHVRNVLLDQSFPLGPCPECGSEQAQPPAPGDQTV